MDASIDINIVIELIYWIGGIIATATACLSAVVVFFARREQKRCDQTSQDLKILHGEMTSLTKEVSYLRGEERVMTELDSMFSELAKEIAGSTS